MRAKTSEAKKPTCREVESLPMCRRRVSISFENAPSRTRQEFQEECDINNIMKKYFKTGVLTHVNRNAPMYGEVPACDFREAFEIVEKSENLFSELPAELRAHFDNDPSKFLEFMEVPENRSEEALQALLPDARAARAMAPAEPVEPPEPSPPADPQGE